MKYQAKTLEYIENYNGEYDKIRDEAIKWIKEFNYRVETTEFCKQWIKHFFNLTEEDLEEKKQ